MKSEYCLSIVYISAQLTDSLADNVTVGVRCDVGQKKCIPITGRCHSISVRWQLSNLTWTILLIRSARFR